MVDCTRREEEEEVVSVVVVLEEVVVIPAGAMLLRLLHKTRVKVQRCANEGVKHGDSRGVKMETLLLR